MFLLYKNLSLNVFRIPRATILVTWKKSIMSSDRWREHHQDTLGPFSLAILILAKWYVDRTPSVAFTSTSLPDSKNTLSSISAQSASGLELYTSHS